MPSLFSAAREHEASALTQIEGLSDGFLEIVFQRLGSPPFNHDFYIVFPITVQSFKLIGPCDFSIATHPRIAFLTGPVHDGLVMPLAIRHKGSEQSRRFFRGRLADRKALPLIPATTSASVLLVNRS